MKYDYARPDGTECEIELPMAAEKPEAIVVEPGGWRAATAKDPAADIFRRVFSVPATAGVVPTNSRGGYRRHRNSEGTLNVPAGECPVSMTMPLVHERGELTTKGGREVQVFKDGTMATANRDPETGKVRSGYPILDNKKNEQRWASKLGVVNQMK